MIKRLFLIFLGMILTACASKPEPDPEPDLKHVPSHVTLSMVTDHSVNPDIYGQGAPLEFQVFELSDNSMFMSADYDHLKVDFKGILKSNFVKNYDYVLMPNEFKFVDDIKLSKDTRYIGVLAHFSEPGISEWKQVVKVKSLDREYHLLMFFKEYDITLKKVE